MSRIFWEKIKFIIELNISSEIPPLSWKPGLVNKDVPLLLFPECFQVSNTDQYQLTCERQTFKMR